MYTTTPFVPTEIIAESGDSRGIWLEEAMCGMVRGDQWKAVRRKTRNPAGPRSAGLVGSGSGRGEGRGEARVEVVVVESGTPEYCGENQQYSSVLLLTPY